VPGIANTAPWLMAGRLRKLSFMSVPSSRKLFARSRLPLALNCPYEPGEPPEPLGSPVTPGVMMYSLSMSRPFTGKSTISLF